MNLVTQRFGLSRLLISAILPGSMLIGTTSLYGQSALPATMPSVSVADQQRQEIQTKLAQIDDAILGKQKEIAALRAQAADLQKQMAEPATLKTYLQGSELLADLPKTAYPKWGGKFQPERVATQEWMKANLPGRTVKWTSKIEKVEVTGNGPFEVKLYWHPSGAGGLAVDSQPTLGNSFAIGEESNCVVSINTPAARQSFFTCYYCYDQCTADEAKMLRELEGKEVTFRGEIAKHKQGDADNQYSFTVRPGYDEVDRQLEICVPVSMPTINSILPKALSPQDPIK